MPTTPQTPWRADRSVHDTIALLLATMQLAAFEALPSGSFRLFSTPPEGLRDLLPGIETDAEVDLVERFPLLETFLSEAGEVWQAVETRRACSDLWSEPLPSGGETHLQAWALKIA